jgi:hypothetical protein
MRADHSAIFQRQVLKNGVCGVNLVRHRLQAAVRVVHLGELIAEIYTMDNGPRPNTQRMKET